MLLFYTVGNAQQNPTGELPIHVFEVKDNTNPFILYFTGDGGWNTFSENLSYDFVKKKHSVITFDCREYFWNGRTPAEFNTVVQKLIDYYSLKWNKTDFAIVGYSFGADVGSFLLNTLKSSTLKTVRAAVLLSPTVSTDFIIRISDLLGVANNADRKYKILPELSKSKVPVLCVFGDGEDIDLKDLIIETSILKKKVIKGSHRFNNNINLITSLVLQTIELKEVKSP